ncbi:MAG: hypothetical protein U0R17_03425 [Acidimicrobiia bacterium]
MRDKINDRGYVALEFVLCVGLLIVPTALLLLQIPRLIEQKDRANSIAFEISNYCANKAEVGQDYDVEAKNLAASELLNSSVLNRANVIEANCEYQNNILSSGAHVSSKVVIEVEAPIIPGLPFERTWQITSSHESIVPKYRSL